MYAKFLHVTKLHILMFSNASSSYKLSDKLYRYRKQDAQKQGLRPRKMSSFFIKVTECFSEYFELIDFYWEP